MYIENFQKKSPEEEKIEAPHYEMIEAPDEELIEEFSHDTLHHWDAPEFEALERDHRWMIYTTVILILIVAYAIYTNSIIMAITFILIGIVGYLYLEKEARVLTFRITPDGIIAGKEMYPFENIQSFWIFYEPKYKKVISLHTKSYLTPFVHIPIHAEDPVKIREILMKYVPEAKHEPGIVDAVERFLGI